jgi:dienelactone hydrolase
MIAAPAHVVEPLPTVLWFHGFRADALAHVADIERCARAGFLAVAVDVVDHGARRDMRMAERIAERNGPGGGGALAVMLECVDRSVLELPALIDALARVHRADEQRMCAVGISMGAYVVYQAIANGIGLRAAVAVVGAPERLGARSPHTRPRSFESTATLSVVAEHDMSVPPAAAQRFHAALTAEHPLATQRIVQLPGVGHLMSAEQWRSAMDLMEAWLVEYG